MTLIVLGDFFVLIIGLTKKWVNKKISLVFHIYIHHLDFSQYPSVNEVGCYKVDEERKMHDEEMDYKKLIIIW